MYDFVYEPGSVMYKAGNMLRAESMALCLDGLVKNIDNENKVCNKLTSPDATLKRINDLYGELSKTVSNYMSSVKYDHPEHEQCDFGLICHNIFIMIAKIYEIIIIKNHCHSNGYDNNSLMCIQYICDIIDRMCSLINRINGVWFYNMNQESPDCDHELDSGLCNFNTIRIREFLNEIKQLVSANILIIKDHLMHICKKYSR